MFNRESVLVRSWDVRTRALAALTALSGVMLVAGSALALPVAPASADEVPCDYFDDPFNPSCEVFDTTGDGWLTPKVSLEWPAATSADPNTTLVATARGQDLFRPVTVTFLRPITPGRHNDGVAPFATVTLGPGALAAHVALPVGEPGAEQFLARTSDIAGRFYGDGLYTVTINQRPSSMSASLPAPRTIEAGEAAQTVTGTVSGGARPVTVQVRARDGAWADIASTTSTAAGGFTVAVPTFWVGIHTYRAYAPATATLTETTSSTSTLTVRRAYRPKGSNQYAITLDGTSRWNSCAPITYAINPARMIKRGRADVRYALREISAATGLRFVSVGTTTYLPAPNGAPANPDGVDIVVGWATAKMFPPLRGNTVGVGGSASSGGQRHDGAVVLESDHEWGRTVSKTRDLWREVMLHEIGHVIGLDHVRDQRMVMYPSTGGPDRAQLTYNKGDLSGLTTLGAEAGGCTGEPEYPRPTAETSVPPATANASARQVWHS